LWFETSDFGGSVPLFRTERWRVTRIVSISIKISLTVVRFIEASLKQFGQQQTDPVTGARRQFF